MLHRVLKQDEPLADSIWSFDYSKADALISYLREQSDKGNLELATTRDLYMLGRS